jgi:hypothetical protein
MEIGLPRSQVHIKCYKGDLGLKCIYYVIYIYIRVCNIYNIYIKRNVPYFQGFAVRGTREGPAIREKTTRAVTIRSFQTTARADAEQDATRTRHEHRHLLNCRKVRPHNTQRLE